MSSSLLAQRTAITMDDVLRLLRVERYSGSITIHFAYGMPKKVESGRPVQVDIYDQSAANILNVLDNR